MNTHNKSNNVIHLDNEYDYSYLCMVAADANTSFQNGKISPQEILELSNKLDAVIKYCKANNKSIYKVDTKEKLDELIDKAYDKGKHSLIYAQGEITELRF